MKKNRVEYSRPDQLFPHKFNLFTALNAPLIVLLSLPSFLPFLAPLPNLFQTLPPRNSPTQTRKKHSVSQSILFRPPTSLAFHLRERIRSF